jgi:hypothetical protein
MPSLGATERKRHTIWVATIFPDILPENAIDYRLLAETVEGVDGATFKLQHAAQSHPDCWYDCGLPIGPIASQVLQGIYQAGLVGGRAAGMQEEQAKLLALVQGLTKTVDALAKLVEDGSISAVDGELKETLARLADDLALTSAAMTLGTRP